MKLRILAVCAVIGAFAAGCAPAILNANKVGDHENATWVYMQLDDVKASGVYRCTDGGGEVVCKRAAMEK